MRVYRWDDGDRRAGGNLCSFKPTLEITAGDAVVKLQADVIDN